MTSHIAQIDAPRMPVSSLRLLVATIIACGLPQSVSGQISLSMPLNMTATPGETILIPINLTVIGNELNLANGNGIGAFSFVISSDSSISSGLGTFSLGSLISNPTYGFSNYTTNNTPGLIRAITASTQGTPELPAGTTGSMALIPFTVSPSAALGNYQFDFLASSGSSTTSLVDNNFNTYEVGTGLILNHGVLTVVPVPEPWSILSMCALLTAIARIRRLPKQ